jgi:energy-coupling factor transport system permease protein
MDSRGYGRIADVPARVRRTTSALVLVGLVGACLGTYGLLDAQSSAVLGVPVLLAGLALAVAGLVVGGRRVRRSTYRPDPWAWPEWAVSACGLACAAVLLVSARLDPLPLDLPLQPLAAPALPWLPALAALVAALPAVLAPRPVQRTGTP